MCLSVDGTVWDHLIHSPFCVPQTRPLIPVSTPDPTHYFSLLNFLVNITVRFATLKKSGKHVESKIL